MSCFELKTKIIISINSHQKTENPIRWAIWKHDTAKTTIKHKIIKYLDITRNKPTV
jgi:hypothetical protein